MSWKKQGFIFKPNDEFDWMKSHAQVPTVYQMDDRFRIFFSTRNQSGKSSIGCVDLDIKNPSVIKKLYDKPVLSLGRTGSFDDDGVMPSCIVKSGNQLRMYYSGWNQRNNMLYHNAIGLAASDDDGLTFNRLYEGPIIDRTHTEPYLAVTPTVLREGNEWKMWYVSGIGWELIDNKYEPVYVIKYAYSADGIDWLRPCQICIPQLHAKEAFASPSVLKIDAIYHMWYCYRDSHEYRGGVGSYRIGYSISTDGVVWQRKDNEAEIGLSQDGWDSSMICYPHVVNANGKLIMFYNGNNFGMNGFGYAVWE